ncbi:YggS family pyridoxal phosphate-dependent enzyme [Metabacillus sp. KIGAM252]|uniref:Pyridoxal phosphate homeostasis protein n=1 Tax=Metabacillus flavus TaxID=2823519 RepID=A0ABS5LDV7_9BACI|nr:YggS family pyridoxal phosphate-dependent enzyme [Metabacillus flavus]MBS2968891.1 YggS family pyridoxal phosphate-dependent enzyme [Metabacillus flavus]
MEIKENLSVIKENINKACRQAGRNPEEVRLVAVTKYVTADRAEEAIEAGIIHLGENRDEGLAEKYERIGNKAVWHFIGSLQSRKVKHVIDKVSYIHSLDRLSLAKEIDKRAEAPVQCFVQVNTSGEVSKHGIKPEETISFIKACSEYPAIQIAGLMTMAPSTDDTSTIRRTFQRLKELKEEIQGLGLDHAPCTELSMGMSSDYMIAIEEGATFIRIGSSLVG